MWQIPTARPISRTSLYTADNPDAWTGSQLQGNAEENILTRNRSASGYQPSDHARYASSNQNTPGLIAASPQDDKYGSIRQGEPLVTLAHEFNARPDPNYPHGGRQHSSDITYNMAQLNTQDVDWITETHIPYSQAAGSKLNDSI